MTRKSNRDEEGWDEKRIKMYKLSTIGWNESTNSFPIVSYPIVFRQQIVDFKKKYASEYRYTNLILDSQWATKEDKETANMYISILEELFKIEPFPAYYDEKYGFLVKRRIEFHRIVWDTSTSPIISFKEEVTRNEELIKKSNKHKEDFKQEVIAEALHPDRVEYLINKHGIEEGMSTFD
jgi:hypothetical protein